MANGTPKHRQSASKRCAALLFFFIFLTLSLTASADNDVKSLALGGRYFVVVWAYQGPDDDLTHAHTFTSFYRGLDLAKGIVRPATISWLPASRAVQPFGVEKGHNFSLHQTLRMACQAGRRIRAWGPYEIRSELYRRAMRRIELLKTAKVRYAMINALPKAMNCIAASGDITPKPLEAGVLWGEAASAEVAHHLSPYFIADYSVALKSVVDLSKKSCPGLVGQFAHAPQM